MKLSNYPNEIDPIAILLIDDDEEDYLITRDLIEDINHQFYTLDWISDYQKALEIMAQETHDVYLVDYRLGAHTGLDLLREALDLGIEAPVILLTGQGDFQIDTQALERGAADYLIKSELDATHLERSIRYSIEQAKNVNLLRKFNQELEQRVEARTEALAMAIKRLEAANQALEGQIKERERIEKELRNSRRELQVALKKEKELSELKSRFISMASHEFRTPLSTILSSVNLIDRYQEMNDIEKSQKHIKRIKSSVSNLNNILEDFLSVDKLEAGKILVHYADLDIQEIILEVQEELTSTLKSGQEIRYLHKGNSHVVTTDPMLFKNILINLLSNAIKYSPENKPIEVSTETNSKKLLLQVTDYGIGIPASEQNHLFERFFRARNVVNIQGTGLGLNIVKRYVNILQGNIDFSSKENEGTTFFLSFPIKITQNEKDTINRR